MALNRDELDKFLNYRPMYQPWWEMVKEAARAQGQKATTIGPPQLTTLLIGYDIYQAYAWLEENTVNHQRISQESFLGYYYNEEEIAPEPMLFTYWPYSRNLRGHKHYGWVVFISDYSSRSHLTYGGRSNDAEQDARLITHHHMQLYNREHGPIFRQDMRKGADAPRGYSSLKEMIDDKSRIQAVPEIRRDRISGNTARRIIHDELDWSSAEERVASTFGFR